MSLDSELLQLSQHLQSSIGSPHHQFTNMELNELGIGLQAQHPGQSKLNLTEDPEKRRPGFQFLGFSKKHLQIIALYGVANIFRGTLILISGAFYPPKAEEKGATGTEIGIVFAVQDLTIFVSSFFYGKKIINRIGPQNVVTISFLGFGICGILFGCTVLIKNRIIFVTFSILIRILTGAFDAGIYPSVFTIYSIEAPGSLSTAVASFEVFFGIGAVGGPVLSGILLEAVGFSWTYATVGTCVLLSATAIFYFVPPVEHKLRPETEETEDGKGIRQGFLKLLPIPRVLLVLFSLFTASASIGFITPTLALHFNYLSPTMIGALFSSGTSIYTLCCPVWGYVADHGIISKTKILVFGTGIVIIGFSFLGPLPFLPYEKATWAGFMGYAIHGIGIAGTIMTAYSHALDAAVSKGFSDNPSTYGLVSSLYIATFSLGNAFGAGAAGVIYDLVGFRWETVFIIGLATLVILASFSLSLVERKRIWRISN